MKIVKRIVLTLILFVFSSYLLIYLFSPLAARIALKKPLAEFNLQLDNDSQIRLNLFLSRLTISDFKLMSNNDTVYSLDSLNIDFSIWPLLTKEIHIHSILLDGMSMQAEANESGIWIAGIQLPVATVEAENKADSTALAQTDRALSYDISLPVIALDNMQFLISNHGNRHTLNVDNVQLLDTQITAGNINSKLTFSADLDGTEVDMSSAITTHGSELKTDIDLNVRQLSIASFQYLLPKTIDKLALASELTLSTTITTNRTEFKASNTRASLSVNNVDIKENRIGLTVADMALDISAPNLQYSLQNQSYQLNAAVNVNVQSAAATTPNNDQIFAFSRLSIKDLQLQATDDSYTIQSPKVSFTELLASQVAAIEPSPALISMATLDINTIEVTNQRISIDETLLGKSHVNITMDEHGTLSTLVDTSTWASTPGSPSSADAKTVAAEPTTPTPALRLGSFNLIAPMELAIEDNANNKDFAKTFVINHFAVSEINSNGPELKTTFSALLKDEAYFTLKAEGWVQPFKPDINLVATTTAREFPLNELAPYLQETIGVAVKSGQLDADIRANIVDNQLDSEAVFLLRGANFAASKAPDDEVSLIGNTVIPLNIALNMLKDADGNIELKVPVYGDINDPDFGIQHVLGLIVKKVVLAQAKNYLMTTFVPYAKVVSVAVVAGESALKVRFQDLNYSPSQIDIQTSQLEFAHQLATLMNTKANLTVSVCPVALADEETLSVADDGSETQLTPTQTAVLRGQAFKNHMVNQLGIESSRLVLCAPQVDDTEGALPRIEFAII